MRGSNGGGRWKAGGVHSKIEEEGRVNRKEGGRGGAGVA